MLVGLSTHFSAFLSSVKVKYVEEPWMLKKVHIDSVFESEDKLQLIYRIKNKNLLKL